LEGQKAQRGADAAALAGVTFLPDVDAAEAEARAVAARNGYLDSTPGDNTDFDTGPAPQVRVTAHGATGFEVEIKVESPAFLGKLVVDSIDVKRYGVAEYIQSVHLGNPSSGLGTGDIPPGTLGLPNDQMWLAVTAYCSDHEQGDPFAVGYWDGPNYHNNHRGCGSAAGHIFPQANPNPTYDPEAYVFVVEYQAGSPVIDVDVYEPGVDCSGSGATDDPSSGPVLNFAIYGPSDTTDHRGYINSNSPISTVSYDWNACISNSTNGDGWWPLLQNGATPSAEGGYYYIMASSRNPTSADSYPGDSFWAESRYNAFSMRALRNGETTLCAFSSADPTCPQLYALDWLPLYRQIPSSEEAFYLAEIDENHAGEKMVVTFFDAAEGIDNLQFVDSNGTAMPFSWRYTDQSDGLMTDPVYFETALTGHTDTCSWGGAGGNPCLDTSTRSDWNDHFVQVQVDIPANYTCGVDCWWQVRYVTGGTPTDRSGWSIYLAGDPVRLVE
ncbi:MAG: hypothetical protein ACR2QK_08555, partial [Acidimicrobiales bacterium]